MAAGRRIVKEKTASPVHQVAVVIALAVERASLQARLDAARLTTLALRQSGPGAGAAKRAAQAAVDAGATALVSWGLAGGLEPELAPGTVVIPHKIVTRGGASRATDADWRSRLVAGLGSEFKIHNGDLLGSERVLDTPRSKARAAVQTGSVAVDMESAAIAEVAAAAGLPFVAVRIVADCVTDTLPPDVGRWISATGQRRLAPVLGVLLEPGQWADLIRLARRYRVAERTMRRLAERLVPSSFEYDLLRHA